MGIIKYFVFLTASIFVGSSLFATGGCEDQYRTDQTMPQFERTGQETEAQLEQARNSKVNAINSNNYTPTKNLGVKAELLPAFDTIRAFPEKNREIATPSIIHFSAHGNVARYSQLDSMVRLNRYVGHGPAKVSKRSALKKIRQYQMDKYGHLLEGIAESIDLPAHGVGIKATSAAGKIKTGKYLADYVSFSKSEHPDLKFVYFGRSSSGGHLMLSLMETAAHLVDGLALMSPPPPVAKWNRRANNKLMRQHADPENSLLLNWEGFRWTNKIAEESYWDLNYNFGGKPVIIFTGSRDGEMSKAERRFFRKLASKHDNIEYHDIKNAGHDVFLENSKNGYTQAMALETLKIYFDFLHKNFGVKN
ncbi:MAG: alpha/beta hydrolase [Bdellovibrionales bacterium]